MNKAIVFILTASCMATFYGQMGAFSMIKHPLKIQFGLSESFLGFLDTIYQIGNLLGNLYLILIPFKKPNRDFFITTSIKCIAMAGFIIGKYIGSQRNSLFCVLMLITGMMNAPVFCPSLIMNRYFDPKKDSFWINFWIGFSGLGDAFAIMFGQLILYDLGWDWSIFLLLCCGILFILALLSQIFFDQVPNNLPEHDNTIDEIKNNINQVKALMKQKQKILITIDFTLQEGLYYNILMWYPYYFAVLSYEQYGSYISIIFPFSYLVGGFLFQYLLGFCQKWVNHIMVFLLSLLVLVHVWLVKISQGEQNSGAIVYYMVLTGVSGLLIGGPLSRVFMSESMNVVKGQATPLYFLFAVYHFCRCLLSTVLLFLIGYFIEKSYSSFFVILLINCIMIWGNGIYRRKFMIQEENSRVVGQLKENMIELERIRDQ